MAIIQFKDVWEMYRIKFVIDSQVSWENFWALKGISFNVEKGETVGIIGENGAGKSTILKLIAGMLKSDRGEIKVQGRVSGLLELGAGFQSELTGKENIYLNSGMFGLTKSMIDAKYEEIVNFASIGKFINAPVKCYSQGMFVRLAFAIAIHVNPDILLIDDTLAVGDEYFQRKCVKKIFELKEQGKTIIFVTHDMNMLSRLCKRAIFLKEGRIVKDDVVDKVIPLYTQMIGSKEGVGILEKNPLKLVFNNGRLFLNWQDKLLTPNSGAYASFLISGKWYSSLQADWDVKRESENKLLATGKFYQLALTQVWRLEIANDYEIKWNIELDSQEPLEIQEGCTNIILTNEYTDWFTTLEKGGFPPIDYKDKNWQALLDSNISMRCIGVEAKETSDGKIPPLIFKQSNYTSATSAQILNADYLTNCRVLQYKTLGLQNYSATKANYFVYFSGKIILDTPDVNNYLNNLEDESTLINGKLKLIFDNGRGILSYNGINLTKANHISTSLFINGRWFFSNLAHWEVKKEEKENKMIAKGVWRGLPVVQIWRIDMTRESSFLWEVKLRVEKELDITEQLVLFMMSEEYTYWFSDYGSGQFPDTFFGDSLDVLQRCIPNGVIVLKSQSEHFPTLFLKFSKRLNNFVRILNSDLQRRARELQIRRVEPEINTKFSPGEYLFFAIEIMLNKEDKQKYICNSVDKLQYKKLKFVFDNGGGRIFWDGSELTKRFGLYTSLRSDKRWYDSVSSAIWKIEEANKDTIKALGKWLHLPIKQYWEIQIKNDNLLGFTVKMRVDKAIRVDRLQTNLMLSEQYSQWITNKKKGLFPLFKKEVDDDWDNICSAECSSRYIGVLENLTDKNSFPSVIFSPQELNLDWCLNIINSDIYFRSRVLQYLNTKQIQLSPGEYPYFKGKITIEA